MLARIFHKESTRPAALLASPWRRLLLALLVFAICAELTARLARPWLDGAVPAYLLRPYLTQLARPDETVVWSGQPGARAELPNAEGRPVTYELNAQGWRDEEFAPFSSPVNALVLGGGFAFGLGVPEEETFPSLLERAAPGLNVWNLAFLAHAPDQQMLLGQRWLTALPWNFLVLQLAAGDPAGVAAHSWSRMNSNTGIPAVIEPPFGRRLVPGLSEALNALAYLGPLENRRFSDGRLRDGLERLLFSIKQNLLLAEERGVPVVLLQASGWGGEGRGGVGIAYQEGVAALAREHGALLVEMPPTEELFFPFPDGHWTPAGHAKAAELLEAALWEPAVEGGAAGLGARRLRLPASKASR